MNSPIDLRTAALLVAIPFLSACWHGGHSTAPETPGGLGEISTRDGWHLKPWNNPNSVVVIDPYHKNLLDLNKVKTDPKVAAIIHKTSEGFFPDPKYSSRQSEAKEHGFSWGAYHLLTNDAPIQDQINFFMKNADLAPEDKVFLDIECLSTLPKRACKHRRHRVSPDDVRTALDYLWVKYDRKAVLYANNSVTRELAKEFFKKPPRFIPDLWYARFKSDIRGVFPIGPWEDYTLWQFSSELKCQYQVPGTTCNMDISVFRGDEEEFRAFWSGN